MPASEATPDIFISYAHEDRDVVAAMAEAFEAQGWRVWWDRQIRVGTQFDEIIAENLRSARAIVVLWSQHSVRSSFVKDESSRARDAGRLHPVRIDDAELPLGFGQIQTIDVPEGAVDSAEFAALVDHIGSVLRQPDKTDTTPPPPLRPRVRRTLFTQPGAWLTALALAAITLGTYYWWRNEQCGVAVNLIVAGKNAIDQQDIDQAMVQLDRAVRICASEPKAWLYRGLARVNTRDSELTSLAEQDLRKALALDLDQQYQVMAHKYLNMLEEIRKGGSAVAALKIPEPPPSRAIAYDPPPAAEPKPVKTMPAPQPQPEQASKPAQPSSQPSDDRAVEPTRGVKREAVARIFDDDKDTRIAATTALVIDQKNLPNFVPTIVKQALKQVDNKSGVINALVLLQNAGPKALNDEGENLDQLLRIAKQAGPQTSALVEKVRAAMRPTVYIQIGADTQRSFATHLQRDLIAQGFDVPSIEKKGKLPTSPEVRVHKNSSRGSGLIIAQQLELLGAPPVKTSMLEHPRGERDTYEVWLNPELCAQRTDPPAACND